MRLRDLGLKVGQLPPGPGNTLADVEGVSAGHAELSGEGLYSGITAIAPYPPQVQERRLFIGRHTLDGGSALTGLQVAEDFGTFSSPIVLAPLPAMGRMYAGLIHCGLQRDAGLTTEAGWPPLVVGVEDLNSPALIFHNAAEFQLETALQTAALVQEGNAGIGRGLGAFGVKGGVGASSRQCELGGRAFTVAALVAAGSGRRLWVDGYPVSLPLPAASAGASAAVLATDAPLLPHQLDRLAQRGALGLARVGLLDASTRAGMALAFSTAGPQGQEPEEQAALAGEELLPLLFQAAAECCEEAVLNALLAAEPAQVGGTFLETLKLEWIAEVLGYQKRM